MALEWSDVDLGETTASRRAVRLEGPRDGNQGRPGPPRPVDRSSSGRSAKSIDICAALGFYASGMAPADAEDRAGLCSTCSSACTAREGRCTSTASHVLFAPGDARRAGPRDPGARRPSGPCDDAAIHAPQSGGDRGRHSAAGSPGIRSGRGNIRGNGIYRDCKLLSVEQVRWWRRRESNPRPRVRHRGRLHA